MSQDDVKMFVQKILCVIYMTYIQGANVLFTFAFQGHVCLIQLVGEDILLALLLEQLTPIKLAALLGVRICRAWEN